MIQKLTEANLESKIVVFLIWYERIVTLCMLLPVARGPTKCIFGEMQL